MRTLGQVLSSWFDQGALLLRDFLHCGVEVHLRLRLPRLQVLGVVNGMVEHVQVLPFPEEQPVEEDAAGSFI